MINRGSYISSHVHVCIIEFIKQVKENVRCEALLSISQFLFARSSINSIIYEHVWYIMFTIMTLNSHFISAFAVK